MLFTGIAADHILPQQAVTMGAQLTAQGKRGQRAARPHTDAWHTRTGGMLCLNR
jgi:hypothetical protein